LLHFLGYQYIQVATNRPTTFTFQMPHQASYDELLSAWDSNEGQALSSGRHYCNSLKKLDDLQKKAKMSGYDDWTCQKHVGLE
jgi:hypothetical protein